MTLATVESLFAPPASCRAITSGDFEFAGYRNAEKYFSGLRRPLSIWAGRPSLRSLRHVTYTPDTSARHGMTGALYDLEGRLIESSLMFRGVADARVNKDPPAIRVERQTPERPGLHVYLGRLMPHYGHFITESMARWWVLQEGLKDVAGYVVHLHDQSLLEWPYVRELLSAAGIDRSKLVFSTSAMRVEELVLPEPALQLESHAYEAYRATCLRIFDGLGIGRVAPTTQPLYVSRSALRKGVYRYEGEEHLEEFMLKNGAKVIYPEKMSLAEQYSMFDSHERIYGIIGSAMHNIAFSRSATVATYFSPAWINPTCFVIDAASEARSTYIRSTTRFDLLHSVAERIEKHNIFGRAKRRGRFHRHRKLDHLRVIDWLTQTGRLE